MIVKENGQDIIRIAMKLLANASYNRGKSEMNWTHQDFEKWCNAYIDELLDAANIKTEREQCIKEQIEKINNDIERMKRKLAIETSMAKNNHIALKAVLDCGSLYSRFDEESEGGCEKGESNDPVR